MHPLPEYILHHYMRSPIVQGKGHENIPKHPRFFLKGLYVYPNPARPGSQVNILLPEPVAATYQVQLFDSKGSLVQKGILVFKNSRSGVFTLNAIAGGSYFLRMTDAKGKTSAVQFIATN